MAPSWRRRGIAVGAAVALVGCGDSRRVGADCPPDCSLREAGARAHVRVGVAAAPRDADDRWNALLTDEFDALSPEDELLWQTTEPERDGWSFGGADRTLGFAHDHRMFTTVSHFVWDQAVDFSEPPAWVLAIDDPDELRRAMREHLETLDARYGDRIDRWIVVNEPLDYFGTGVFASHFRQVLGPDYIAETFRIAREAAPRAQLFTNEIFTESNPAKADALVALAEDLVSRGVPIDGVGLQGHLFPGEPDLVLVRRTLERLAALGLTVAITELDAPVAADVPDRDAVQAERMSGMVAACLAVQACDSVTFWGVSDDVSWLEWLLGPGFQPLLFDADLQPKPAYFAVRDALLRGRP